MRTKATSAFVSVTTEGAILPSELLRRVAAGDRTLDGLNEGSYHLSDERLNEAISRSWSRLVGAWASFRATREKLPASDLGTSLTRDRWLLPLFQELGYGRLGAARNVEAGGTSFPISHLWQSVPIHLVSFRTDLDTRTSGVAGAARRSPHSLLQELLNTSDGYLWGFVSNGVKLRVLRDNASLTRQAYVEFDLATMFDGEIYSDFVLLWLICHESRVEGERPDAFHLERWSRAARAEGVRALDQLRVGVEKAIEALGSGFLAHPANGGLRAQLQAGTLTTQGYYRELLRLVYRLLFLFVAEDRDLLQSPSAPERAKVIYRAHYSTARLRQLAVRRRGTRHADLWDTLRLVMNFLGGDDGCATLALPSLGSFLFSRDAISDLSECAIANRDLLDAIRELSVTDDAGVRRQVDFRNLRSEELGSIYEALLELHPEIHADAARFELRTAAGHERKTTGSYYTPDALVQCLLDSALEPILSDALRAKDPEHAILALRVCDPACGSGHFLVAAAHRIAKRLAAVRTGDSEPSPEAMRHALRDVVGRCIYGVDLNPMAVELCKVALWMEGIDPGRPLSFLDYHVQAGNSLLGATPALIARGLPDGAFVALDGDDKALCRELKKRNRAERESGQAALLLTDSEPVVESIRSQILALTAIDDSTVAGVHAHEERWHSIISSAEYANEKLVADAWCAAFFWEKQTNTITPLTTGRLQALRSSTTAPRPIVETIQRHAERQQFFHWHLAFPDVFLSPSPDRVANSDSNGWSGGFDVVLGNPPWDQQEISAKEWFASARPAIAEARTAAAQKRMIQELAADEPSIFASYVEAKRSAEATTGFLTTSGRFPLCGRGRVNAYSVFTELITHLCSSSGRAGGVVPTGIATDDNNKTFFSAITTSQRLVSLFDFENRQSLFPAVDSRMRFSLLTIAGAHAKAVSSPDYVFFAHSPNDLLDPARRIKLTVDDIALLSPLTGSCPVFRSERDATLTKAIHRAAPILMPVDESNPWRLQKLSSLNVADDSEQFQPLPALEHRGAKRVGDKLRVGRETFVRLFEAKMVWFFDHRAADVVLSRTAVVRQGQAASLSLADHQDPWRFAEPRHWVREEFVRALFGTEWTKEWFLCWRDVTSATNERTLIPALIPFAAFGRNNLPALFPGVSAQKVCCLVAGLSSLACDYVARSKVGGLHMAVIAMMQVPMLTPNRFDAPAPWQKDLSIEAWLVPRVMELTFTAWDHEQFARDAGYSYPPLRWDADRRFALRCEIDAAFFHLFGLARSDAEYILDTFGGLQKNDERAYGSYRTKQTIVAIYDGLTDAIAGGYSYQTRLDPPPADPRVAHDAADPTAVAIEQIAEELSASADGDFAAPEGISEADLALFALVDVLRQFKGPVAQERVRIAATLVRNPALAVRFLSGAARADWMRVVGSEAKPLPRNVVRFSQYVAGVVDHAWGTAVRQLVGGGAITSRVASGTWEATDRLESSEQPWVAGRARVAVALLRQLDLVKAEQNLRSYAESVNDGTASVAAS